MAYLGFSKLKNKLAHQKGVKNPGAIAAKVEHDKYKKKDIIKHQQSGTSMKHVRPKKEYGSY